jgi:hypothetical protein
MKEKTKVTIGLLSLMLLLGIADSALLEGLPEKERQEIVFDDPVVQQQPDTPTVTPAPTGGVRKALGPDILQTLVSNNFTFDDTRERFILTKVLEGNQDTVTTKALLIKGDRAGAIGWISSPNVKKHYLVLKEALHSAFTPEVKDLLDETQRRENHPTRNLLTFFDPGILPERVVFVRVRERLYEFHISEGSSNAIFNLIEGLTK